MLRFLLPLALVVALATDAAAQTKNSTAPAGGGWGDPAPTAAPVSDNKANPDAGAAAAPAAGGGMMGGGGAEPIRQAEGVYAAPGSPVILQRGRSVGSYDNGAHARAREKANRANNPPAPAPAPVAETPASGAEGTAAPAATGTAASGASKASCAASSVKCETARCSPCGSAGPFCLLGKG